MVLTACEGGRAVCLGLSSQWEERKWSCLRIPWVVKGREREGAYHCTSFSTVRVEPVDSSTEPSRDGEEAGGISTGRQPTGSGSFTALD